MNDLSATERCVKCGLCLPHCPTFRLTGNEADSPRGRISLMQMLDAPDSAWSPGLFTHLDQCLLCHACEAMCPSKVPFERLMDNARERIGPYRHRTWFRGVMRRMALGTLTSRAGRHIAAALLAVLHKLGTQRLAELPALPATARRLLLLIPEPPRYQRDRGSTDQQAGAKTVNLFTGCTGTLFDRPALLATRRLLDRLGYKVVIPEQQGCCGALHQHSGERERAQQLAQMNLAAFSGNDAPVLTFASGCSAHLLGYTDRLPEAGRFAQRVTDILDFLVERHAGELRLKPIDKKIALHIPCTQRNVLRQDALVTSLGWIPDLQLSRVNPDGGCCGAAGSYMLTQPELADRLRAPLVDAAAANGADILLTTNIGCALHLAAGIRQSGAPISVMHPVTLLESLLI